MHKNTRKVKIRIKKAFDKLFENKIIAIPDFLCCNNCGASEMEKIMDKDGFIGFAFYHAQDTEMLNETGECYISFWV